VLERQIDALLEGRASETPQDDAQATYFGGRKPEDGRIDWSRSSLEIFNLIRAVTDPYPGAFTDTAGVRLMVWWAESRPQAKSGEAAAHKPGEILSVAPLVVATGDGALEITRLEWRGGPPPELAPGRALG
jgi:methionyl-tRNA formyltransferase